MPGIPAAELASIRSDAVKIVCDKTCDIYRKTTTVGSAGEPIGTYALINTTVAGLGQPSAGELANYDYAIGDKAAWTVHLPFGTDATHQDHLVIDGQVLEVHILLNPKSYEIFHNVIAAEIK